MDLAPYAKAVAAFVVGGAVSGLSAATVAIADGSISTGEWLSIALAALIGAASSSGIVYAVPNKPLD